MRATHFTASTFAPVFFPLSFALAACGSSNNPATPPASITTDEDAGTKTDDAAIEASASDASNAADYHDVYPAPHPPLPQIQSGSDRVLTNPEIVTVTLAGMDPTLEAYVQTFDETVGSGEWWSTVMSGYGVGAASFAGNYEIPDTFSGQTIDDSALQTWIGASINSHLLPDPSLQTIYVFYMPNAATITLEGDTSCQGFAGYHNSGGFTANDGTFKSFYYAIVNECYAGFAGVTTADIDAEQTVTASHELAEAATDPDVNGVFPGGYYMIGNDAWAPSTRGGEVGDLCENQPDTTWNNYTVQTIWNAASAAASHSPCIPAAEDLYFLAQPHTQIPSKTIKGGPSADGYVVVKKGTSVDFELDVFSTAPTAPLTIVAGKQSFGGGPNSSMTFDPTMLAAIGKGITVTLSQSTAVNGDRVTMTIAVDDTATSGSTRFYTRAVLSQTDYHSFPVLLYIP